MCGAVTPFPDATILDKTAPLYLAAHASSMCIAPKRRDRVSSALVASRLLAALASPVCDAALRRALSALVAFRLLAALASPVCDAALRRASSALVAFRLLAPLATPVGLAAIRRALSALVATSFLAALASPVCDAALRRALSELVAFRLLAALARATRQAFRVIAAIPPVRTFGQRGGGCLGGWWLVHIAMSLQSLCLILENFGIS